MLLMTVPLSALEIWRLDQLARVGGHPTTVIGAPEVVEQDGVAAARFGGFDDALLIHSNPVAGLKAFTIEVLIRPAPDGLAEQRFVHIQPRGNPVVRVMIETRVMPDGQWCLDTALFSPTASRVLIDRTKLHPPSQWAWVALRYDGRTMAHFVNGAWEAEGEFDFPPTPPGQTTLGVRHNLVSWYKGGIREVRIHPSSLPAERLQRWSAPAPSPKT